MLKVLRNSILSILIFSSFIFADQTKNTIKGRVTEKNTGKAISGVNVFLDGTTIGTTTDKKGVYKIPNIKSGLYELVVSMIGYETETKKIEVSKSEDLVYDFQLKERVYETKSVVVEGEEDYAWQRRFVKFKNLFLGTTNLSKKCKITNKEIVEFDETDEFLTGYAPEPIIVINNATGYKVKCFLKDFYYDKSKEKTWFSLKTFFKKLEPKNEEEKIKWAKNRKQAFETSLEFFLAWLQDNDIDEYRYKLTQNRYLEKEYYLNENNEEKVMNVKELMGKNDEGLCELKFPQYLKVTDTKYGEKSTIKLFSSSVPVDKYGFLKQPHSLEVFGYFGKLGIADKLPKHYLIKQIDGKRNKN